MFKVIEDTQILLTRGDTLDCDIIIYDGNTEYTPASGDVIKFYLKHAKLNPQQTEYIDTEPVIEKTISGENLHLDPSDTASLGFGAYVYDIELTKANGDVDTFVNNASFTILPEVN